MQKRAVEQLTPDQFSEWIAIDIEARRKGGPNLRDKYLRLVEQLPKEIRREYRARTIELWSKVENDLATPKPYIHINGRRYPADEWKRSQRKKEASFFGPKSQPPADAEPEDKPKEPDAPQALVPVGFAPLPNDDVLELDPAAPFDNAQKIVSLRAWHAEEGMRTWHYWQQSFWQWAPFPQSEITNLVSSARVGPLVS